MDDLEAQLAMRGIANSTIATNARNRMLQSHRAEAARTRMGVTQQLFDTQLAPLKQIFEQGVMGRELSTNEFFQFLDRQFRSDAYQDTQTNQAITALLAALGQYMPSIQSPQIGIPNLLRVYLSRLEKYSEIYIKRDIQL